MRILAKFLWHHVSLIVDETDWTNTLIRQSMETVFMANALKAEGYQIQLQVQSFSFRNLDGELVNKTIEFEKLLQAASRVARGECIWLMLRALPSSLTQSPQ